MTPATTDVNANMRRHAEERRVQRAKSQPAAPAAAAPEPAVEPERRDVAGTGKGDRWATYNAFVDVISPRLTLAERAVWHVMFRHTRNGVVQTSERQLSTAAAIDKATAGRALRQLVQLRLVWPVMKSSNKASTSRYGLHPRPEKCLPAVMAEAERRQDEARERRQRNGGDRRGRHRTSTTNRVNGSPGCQG